MSIKDNKLINYIVESKKELKKVTWPSKKETINYSILVISISLAVAAFMGAIDYIFSLGIEQIVK